MIQLQHRKRYEQAFFTEEDTQMVKVHMKRWSISPAIREMHIKVTMRHHCTCMRMGKIKNYDITKCWQGCGETGLQIHCWWDVKWYTHSGKHFGYFLKNETCNYPMTQ